MKITEKLNVITTSMSIGNKAVMDPGFGWGRSGLKVFTRFPFSHYNPPRIWSVVVASW